MVSTWFQPCFISYQFYFTSIHCQEAQSYQFYFIPIHCQEAQERKKHFLHTTYQDFDQTGQCLSFPVLELSIRLPSYSTSPLHHDADGHYNSKIISNNNFTIRSIKISNDGARLFPETCTINTVLGDFPYWQDGIFNSLVPGRFKWYFRHVIFKLFSVIDGWGISCKIVLRWMPLDLADDKSTLVRVMAWCRQATSHYLSQCWPRSISPYGATRPQWVKLKFCWHSGTSSSNKWQWLQKHDMVPVEEVQNGCP